MQADDNNANNDQAQAHEVVEEEPDAGVPEPDHNDQEDQEAEAGNGAPAPPAAPAVGGLLFDLLRDPRENPDPNYRPDDPALGLGQDEMEEWRHPGGGGDAARYPLFPIFRHLPQRVREQRERDREDRRIARAAAQEHGRQGMPFVDPEAVRQRQAGGGDLNIRRRLPEPARAAPVPVLRLLPNQFADPRRGRGAREGAHGVREGDVGAAREEDHEPRGEVAAARMLPPAGRGALARGRGAAAVDQQQAGPSGVSRRGSAEDASVRGRGEVRGRGHVHRRGRGRGRASRSSSAH